MNYRCKHRHNPVTHPNCFSAAEQRKYMLKLADEIAFRMSERIKAEYNLKPESKKGVNKS
jgi:hypothetical protein